MARDQDFDFPFDAKTNRAWSADAIWSVSEWRSIGSSAAKNPSTIGLFGVLPKDSMRKFSAAWKEVFWGERRMGCT